MERNTVKPVTIPKEWCIWCSSPLCSSAHLCACGRKWFLLLYWLSSIYTNSLKTLKTGYLIVRGLFFCSPFPQLVVTAALDLNIWNKQPCNIIYMVKKNDKDLQVARNRSDKMWFDAIVIFHNELNQSCVIVIVLKHVASSKWEQEADYIVKYKTASNTMTVSDSFKINSFWNRRRKQP